MSDHQDIEIYLRPCNEYKDGMNEQVFGLSFEEIASWSTHNLIDFVADEFDAPGAGEWKVGIRRCGDEFYFQRFSVVQPHAKKRGEGELTNHLAGVLKHWRR